MKKNYEKKRTNRIPSSVLKLVLTMKLTLILICGFGLFSSLAENTYAQATKLSLNLKDASIKDVLLYIEDHSEFSFMYDNNEVDVNRKVNIKVKDETIGSIINQLFTNEPITTQTVGKHIIIIPQNRPAEKFANQQQQQKTVSGKITDSSGVPLPGVTVVVKGTTNGTVSDAGGNYSLSNISDDAILQFSFVGMRSKEMAVSGKSSIDIIMEEDAIGIEEVVAIGYGTMKKSDLTGAVASVSEEVLQSRPVSSFEDAIKGRTSGVQIRQTGGDLAGDFTISIRGIGSVTGSNNPLIVVDGVPLFSSSFSTINPKDIQSIDILKDASATAIYGARAANGVLIITTKKGQKGKTRLTFDADFGIEEITKNYDVMNTEQQRQLFLAAFTNSSRSTDVYDDPDNEIWQIDTDWQKLGTRTAFRQNYNLGFSGGTEKTDYSGSLSYLDREGTLLNTDLQSWSLRINVNSEINDWLKLSTNLTGSHQKQNVAQNDSWGSNGFRSFVYQHSYTEAYDENGELTAVNSTAAPYFGANENPLINLLLPTRERDLSRILGNAKLDITLKKGLILSGNFGSDILSGYNYTYLPVYSIGRYSRTEGSVTVGSYQQINWVGDLTLDYQTKIDNHEIKALAGFSAQQYIAKSSSTTGTGTIDNSLNQLSNQTDFSASSSDVTAGLLSTFVRLNYNFANKYLVTGTVRRDGSSKFGSDNRYGIFPSASFAWRISEESFFQSNKLIDDLKLRTSYGLTGNQNIGDFAFISKSESANYIFGNDTSVGNAASNIGTSDLKWEATVQFDAGIDISLFNGRIYSSLDYYNKKSKDLLVSVPLPMTSGVSEDLTVNLGSLKNSGFEFSINTKNIAQRQFSWTTNFNISYNKNKVLDIGTNSLGEPLEIQGTSISLSSQSPNLTRAGHVVGGFYMYQYIGNWQLGEEEEAAAWYSGAVPGDPKYADLNNNGELDEEDKAFVGSPHPKFFGGIDNTFSHKQFSLSFLIEFAGGYKLYNTARNLFSRGVPFVQNFAEVADFWTEDNPTNKNPRPSQGGTTTTLATMVSTRYLEDAAYLKLKNVRLSYDLPPRLLNQKIFSSARVTLTGTNIITLTNYLGLDPEASSQSSLLSAGMDFTPYPPTRLVSLAVQLTF
ncbi:SusC/RagA family TonB-linked outer membrane protein [Maribellus comscasis]|uniref:SusC/RagA family TonB-linked outer membrane protein n=1 Tax=Maribellus comscasis TaxID=2681766 RepID=A0A6I6K845_9BACT|nr:TonB-dependent receptor [Maribellus comscasis]QGY46214.1 SusC/RagA family TonB-linked outer membrane protein [Maribellus comscasis]